MTPGGAPFLIFCPPMLPYVLLMDAITAYHSITCVPPIQNSSELIHRRDVERIGAEIDEIYLKRSFIRMVIYVLIDIKTLEGIKSFRVIQCAG